MDAPSEFWDIMDRTAKLYRQQINRESVDWYWERLQCFTMAEIKKAFQDAVDTQEFFPSIAALRKLIPAASQTNLAHYGAEWPTFDQVKRAGPIAKDCLSLIFAKLEKKISTEDYYRSLMGLGEKYKPLSFGQAAEEFKQKNPEKFRRYAGERPGPGERR
jgi:hypothetical protein